MKARRIRARQNGIAELAGEPRAPAQVTGRRYHFHAPGFAYAIVTFVLVLGAVNGQNNLLFWLFGLAVAGLIISGVVSGGALMGIEIEREVGPATAVGELLTIRYRVRNKSWLFSAFALTIEELVAEPLGPAGWVRDRWSRLRGRGPANAVTEDAWVRHLSSATTFVAYVPARGSTIVETQVRGLRRGEAAFGPLRVWTTFPFGLTKKSITFRQATRVLVRPRTAPVRAGLLQSVQGEGGSGAMFRRSRTGDEFYSLREYASGDSVRMVAWRPTARLGHAVVREMAARPSRRVWIVLHFGGAAEEACEKAISVAAGVAGQAIEAGLEPGLAIDGRCLEPARGGRKQVEHVLDALGRLNLDQTRRGVDGLAPLGPMVWRNDGFAVVEAQRGGAELPTPDALRLSVDDLLSGSWSATAAVTAAPKVRWWERLAAWIGLGPGVRP